MQETIIVSAKHKYLTLENGVTTTRSPVLVHWASAQLREVVVWEVLLSRDYSDAIFFLLHLSGAAL